MTRTICTRSGVSMGELRVRIKVKFPVVPFERETRLHDCGL